MRLIAISIATCAALALSASASAQYGYNSDCEDAKSSAESAASDLSSYSRRLQRCAEAGDYSDDCSTEFRRVRSAHSDYESAVSEVSSYCE
jgi:hypothetical protein